MVEESSQGDGVRSNKLTTSGQTQPQTRNDLQGWIREHLALPRGLETSLIGAIDAVFTRHERLWQESKHEAIQALSSGFADKMAHVQTELSAKDATVSSISRYFEALVADLTDKSHRDPKTKLMNFGRFTEQLESFLALEQRGRWCAIGLVDITGFKWYNDALGHAVGDQVIERVAALLREQVDPTTCWRRNALVRGRPNCTRGLAATSSVFSSLIWRNATRLTRLENDSEKQSSGTIGRSRIDVLPCSPFA